MLSSLPGANPATLGVLNLDKAVHFFTFFLLSALFLMAYTFNRPLVVTVIFMTIFGLATELIQLYVPNRLFSFYDLIADILGVLAALITYKLINKRLQMV